MEQDLFSVRNRRPLRIADGETLVAAGSITYWHGPTKGVYWIIHRIKGENDTRPTEVKPYFRTVGGATMATWNGIKVGSQDAMKAEFCFPTPMIVTYGEEIGVRVRTGQIGDAVATVMYGWEVFQ